MYEEYYDFTEKPFSLTPDPKYLYRSESHANAFELLQYSILRREGFVVVTGDIGTGKTTLCRALLEQLDRKTFTALVLNPFLSEEDLLRIILQDFGVVSREEVKRGRLAGVSKQELIDTLNDFLLSLLPLRARALLILDEAQNLPLQVLEQIRILSNLETDKEKLLQIVLVGQLNLRPLLRAPAMRQLDQRISIRYELKPLNRDETAAYVAHRLTVAGGAAAVTFTPEALDLVHRCSDGIPRLINLLCDRALLGGYAARTNRIVAGMVGKAAESLDLPAPRRTVIGWIRVRAARMAAAAAAAALVYAAAVGVASVAEGRGGWRSAPGATIPVAEQTRAVAAPGEGAVPPAAPVAPVGDVAADRSGSATAPVVGTAATAGISGLEDESTSAADDDGDGLTARPSTASARAGRSILVGSFRLESEAAALMEQLQELGYRPYRVDIRHEERGVWRQVRVGGYRDLESARVDEARLRQLPGYADARLLP
jgi:type II secretory pathway predicted ATPase ExeA